MSRRIVGYVNGKAQWEDLGPATWIEFGAIGGRSVADATPFMAPVVRPQAARYSKPEPTLPDYQARAAKGWATRRAK